MDERAAELRAVYEREAPSIRRYLARLVGPAEAEDLAQEAFARAQRSVDSYRGEASLATWIRRIASNLAIDHLRAPASRLVPLDSPQEEAARAEPEPSTVGGDPERGLIRRQMSDCVLELVRSLPEPHAEVILLAELRGLRDREVAEALGVTLEAAKIRLHRARAKLRELMLGECDLYRDPETGLACDRKSPSDEEP